MQILEFRQTEKEENGGSVQGMVADIRDGCKGIREKTGAVAIRGT